MGPSEQLLDGKTERGFVRQPRVEALERGEEPRDIVGPRLRRQGFPHVRAVAGRDAPVQQVADVGEDVRRRHARRGARAKRGELRRRGAHGLAAAIGERRERVASSWRPGSEGMRDSSAGNDCLFEKSGRLSPPRTGCALGRAGERCGGSPLRRAARAR